MEVDIIWVLCSSVDFGSLSNASLVARATFSGWRIYPGLYNETSRRIHRFHFERLAEHLSGKRPAEDPIRSIRSWPQCSWPSVNALRSKSKAVVQSQYESYFKSESDGFRRVSNIIQKLPLSIVDRPVQDGAVSDGEEIFERAGFRLAWMFFSSGVFSSTTWLSESKAALIAEHSSRTW